MILPGETRSGIARKSPPRTTTPRADRIDESLQPSHSDSDTKARKPAHAPLNVAAWQGGGSAPLDPPSVVPPE